MSYDFECFCDEANPHCLFCEMQTDDRLRSLSKSIAIGAALCRADRNGYERGKKVGLLSARDSWRPGCQRPAP